MQCILAKLKGTSQLLILDEAQHLSERSFDAIRAINDKAHIGIVYAGNPSVLRRMYGRKAEEFDQVYSRTTYKCCLNNSFTKSDISTIYEEFGFNIFQACSSYILRDPLQLQGTQNDYCNSRLLSSPFSNFSKSWQNLMPLWMQKASNELGSAPQPWRLSVTMDYGLFRGKKCKGFPQKCSKTLALNKGHSLDQRLTTAIFSLLFPK